MNNLEKLREKLRFYEKRIIDRDMLTKILSKFAQNYSVTQISNLGLISPIKRGKYYFNNLGSGFADPYEVIALYMGDSTYCLGGLGVYNTYGFSTQIIEWYTVYNTKISGKRILGNTKIIFKRQRESFFYGIEEKKIAGTSYKIMSPERAFIERIKEADYFNTVPENIDTKKLSRLAYAYSSKKIQNKIKKLCS